MKIETTIPARKDGTVNVSLGDARYTFAADETGRLVADVSDDNHARHLLSMGDFLPADQADYDAATVLIGVPDLDGVEDLQDDSGDAPIERPRRGRPRKG